MEYRALLTRLFAARAAGVVLGVDRVRRVLDAMGRPDQRPAVRVLVGGTNGKGTTAAYLEAIARSEGRRTGLFTSPHLCRFTERFRVDGGEVSAAAVCAAAEHVVRCRGDALTFFEQSSCIAAQLFARAAVDVAIFEVGLGGRLDATNAIPAEVAVVTGAALDHQDYLGDTLEAIAAEKAGIFRAGAHAVIGAAGEAEAVPWLVRAARDAGAAEVRVVDPPGGDDYLAANAACAVAAAGALTDLGVLGGGAPAWRRAIAAAAIRGRLETVATAPEIVVDGAHNPHGAAATARAIAARRCGRRLVVVVATSRDKDVRGIVEPLVTEADGVIATRFAQPRAETPERLAAVCRRVRGDRVVVTAADAAAALDRARAWAGDRGLVLVAGSLFLAGEARAVALGEEIDDIPVTDPIASSS